MLRAFGNNIKFLAKADLRIASRSCSIRFYSTDSAESSDSGNDTEFSCLSVKQRVPCKRFNGSHAPEAPDPMMCCGSGCLNCVWIEYGVQRAFYYSDQPIENTLQEIDENVYDQCLREYIKREIRKRTRR
uniref:Oxidoreductase-like domain-containing protein n=1 Tax=Syphacia muris TaxID=451379 RepID=A0A0N5AD47_9BILA